MIIYTPMQLELVLEGLDEMKQPSISEAKVNGVSALVQDDGQGGKKVVKLLSTDPADYMKPDLLPGSPVMHSS